MIAHISVPSETPKETALFFAAIMDGVAFDFPVVAGAAIAVARDGSGSAVEVYPPRMMHHPGTGQVEQTASPRGPATMPWEDQIYPDAVDDRASSFHLAIETKLTRAEVISRASTLGWRALYCDRAGVFGVVEVWIDNRYLVEVLPPEESVRYRNFMNPQGCAAMFGAGILGAGIAP